MQLGGLCRQAEALNQLRTGYENVAVRQKVSCHQGFVNDRVNTKGDIDAVLNQVHSTFGGVDMNLDVGVAMLESGKQVPPRLKRRRQR